MITSVSLHGTPISDYDIAMKPAAAAVAERPRSTGIIEQKQPDAAPMFLAVMISINENLEYLKQETIRLVPSDAGIIFSVLSDNYSEALQNARNIVKAGTGANLNSIEKELYTMSCSMLEIFENLEVAATEKDIDETSEDYQMFIENMVMEASNNPSTDIGGREALFALFEN